MTSAERHLNPGQPRWDHSVQKYKPFRDVFCEQGLFSILFLACGRSEVTKRCLLSTVDAVSKTTLPVEWIFMENGLDEDNYRLFQELPLERKVVIRQKNFGINNAWNQMINISRGEFYCKLENDFENRLTNFDFLSVAYDIFQEKQDVGMIQLRAVWDPCENWGLGKNMYNPWSCDSNKLGDVKIYNEQTISGYKYLLGTGFYGFNNNPILIRKKLYREVGFYPEPEMGTDGRHGETFWQEMVLKNGCAIAHISSEIYYHVGKITTKAI